MERCADETAAGMLGAAALAQSGAAHTRVLYVTSRFPFGHGESFLAVELEELERQAHDVTIVPTRARGGLEAGKALAFLPRTRAAPLLSVEIAAAALAELGARPRRTMGELAQLCRSRNLRVLVKNLAVYPKGLWLARLARELGIEHIHAHWAGTSGTLAMIVGAVTGIPWSLTVHRWDIREDNLLRRKVEQATFVRAISNDGLRDLRRTAGPTATPTVLIHMGVTLAPRSVTRLGPCVVQPLRVLVPANLLDVKGHRHLIEAVALLRERGVPVHCGFAGQGPLRSELEAQIAGLDLADSCAFLGQIPHGDLLEQIDGGVWDVVVLPSVLTAGGEKEGIPVAFLEAMSRGLPVVGTAAGGVPELLEHGAGLLVPPADSAALAAALERLAADVGLRARLGRLGRERVERDFAAPRVVSELAARFERAPARRPPNPARADVRDLDGPSDPAGTGALSSQGRGKGRAARHAEGRVSGRR